MPSFKTGITIFNGSNGCGKTTLLRLLAGKYQTKLRDSINPNYKDSFNGASLFFEETLTTKDESLEKNLNYINSFVLYDLELRDDLIKDLNLGQVLHTKFSNCSTGEKKKFLTVLNLSQANKDVFFLDEPFENIDTKSKENLVKKLESLFSEKNTLFISSHQPQILKDIPHQILDFDAA